ncbi:MAG: hypothetical protein ABRQ39_11685 [Candidatus Eremiobacterota bacterium]
MKKGRQKLFYPSGAAGSKINPVSSSRTSPQKPYSSQIQNKKDRVDPEEQKKFMETMGGALHKLKEEKKEEEERERKRLIQEKELKKMPKMIIPDLGPDFRHEVKFTHTDEGSQEFMRRIEDKAGLRNRDLKSAELRGDMLDIEG